MGLERLALRKFGLPAIVDKLPSPTIRNLLPAAYTTAARTTWLRGLFQRLHAA